MDASADGIVRNSDPVNDCETGALCFYRELGAAHEFPDHFYDITDSADTVARAAKYQLL
jgi:hypothetical protein